MTIGDSHYVADVVGKVPDDEQARSTALRRELERLRDDVIRCRSRANRGTTIDKCVLLTLLAEAAGRGERQVGVNELAGQLASRSEVEIRPSINTVRKALIDLIDMIDDAYRERPPAHHRARIESNGGIALEETNLTTSESAFRTILRSLPTVARQLLPWGQAPHAFRDKWRFTDSVSRDSAAADSQYEWLSRVLDPELIRNVSEADVRLVRDLFYEMTSSALAGVIHNFDAATPIVAIEHYPTHKLDRWDDDLTWLNDAYRGFALRRGRIVRVVYFDSAGYDKTVSSEEWWERWCEHIEVRAKTDKIAIVTGKPDPAWNRALDGDYLVLTNTLVIRYDDIDFPRSFEGLPATAYAAARVNNAAERLAAMSPSSTSQSLTWLADSALIRSDLERARGELLGARKDSP